MLLPLVMPMCWLSEAVAVVVVNEAAAAAVVVI
jgi:hypothetical protein